MEHKIKDESNQTRALQMLLFESSTIYDGQCLFEQFDAEIQEEIRVQLEQASDVLDRAYSILNRPSNTSLRVSPTPSHDSLVLGDTPTRRPGSFQRFRWSLMDKKRVEAILRDFADSNDRIHENLKLWCLGTSIGVDLRHLKRLETDINSRKLGFDADARLQLATGQRSPITQTLEINELELRQELLNVEPLAKSFGVLTWRGRNIMAEYRSYAAESPVPVEIDTRTRDLVDRLANLLHQPKEAFFRTPKCQGWVKQMQQNRVVYLFNIPETAKPLPIRLLDALQSDKIPTPSLSQRFHLASKLARCISQLQLVKWVHESFRSENIIFFRKENSTSSQGDSLDLTEPWIFGFEFSRPEAYFSHGVEDTCLGRNIYRHPDRQLKPTQVFSKIHDIYALGVVLLEIGLWQPATSLEKHGFAKVRDPQAIKDRLVRQAERRLGSKMGDKYKHIVLRCLEGRFDVVDDTKEDLKLQQAFRSKIVTVLQNAAENI
ncbi:hypothetical protein NW752_003161 [Fusarium irregulare]|nr:hypothetical protein NW752_003161 [Fusarium irregulare]